MIRVENSEAFQRLKKNFRRVDLPGFIRTMRTDDEYRPRTTRHVVLKNFVRVVKVGNDDVEPGKVTRQIPGQFATTRKKARQRAGFDGLHAIYQPADLRELRDVRVAENFQMRLRELLAPRSDGRQGENEITNRTIPT